MLPSRRTWVSERSYHEIGTGKTFKNKNKNGLNKQPKIDS